LTVGDSNLIVPGTTAAELDRLRDLIFEGPPPATDRRFSPALVFLAVRNAVVLAVALAVALAFSAIGRWALLALLLVPVEWVVARWRLARQHWGFTATRLAYVTRYVTHRSHEVDPVKAQVVTLRQTYFQRRRDLASVKIQSAEGRVDIHMIPLAEAAALRDLVLYRVEATGRSWM